MYLMWSLLSSYLIFLFGFFFFKQNPAYDMRISDWSSDVCSSDLADKPSGWRCPLPAERAPVRPGIARPEPYICGGGVMGSGATHSAQPQSQHDKKDAPGQEADPDAEGEEDEACARSAEQQQSAEDNVQNTQQQSPDPVMGDPERAHDLEDAADQQPRADQPHQRERTGKGVEDRDGDRNDH